MGLGVDLEQTLLSLFKEWREEVKDSEKARAATMAELDRTLKDLLQYENSLQQRISETKENVRKLLKSS